MGPDATLSDASALALEFATKLHAMEKIPIYTYGDVSADKLVLKNIRRDLGYFLKVPSFNRELDILRLKRLC